MEPSARYEDASQRLRRAPNKDVGRGATAEDVSRAERELKLVLPQGYKAFLHEFGWGGAGSWEIYGLGADVPPLLDLVRVTVSERTEAIPPIPDGLLPIMNDGGGNHFCLYTGRLERGECPVVFWDHELGENQVPARVADDFTSWLAERVDEVAQD